MNSENSKVVAALEIIQSVNIVNHNEYLSIILS